MAIFNNLIVSKQDNPRNAAKPSPSRMPCVVDP
jgi:hypothetical protein